MDWQDVVVGIVVLCAALYLIRRNHGHSKVVQRPDVKTRDLIRKRPRT